MPISRHPSTASGRLFSIGCKWPLDCTSGSQCMGWRQMQSIATIPMTLRIERSERQRFTVFTLIGRIEAEHIAELIELFDRDYQNIILDLGEVRVARQGAVRFLRTSGWNGKEL